MRECTHDDMRELVRMRVMNIEDENNGNPGARAESPEQAEQRIRGFLARGYRGFIFQLGDELVGCTLCDMTASPPYLRQFHILHERRRMGYGRAAFHALLELLGTDEVTLGVLPHNERGLAFWRSIGFEPRSMKMLYKKPR